MLPHYVYPDTEVFVTHHHSYGTPRFVALSEWVSKGRLELVLTDVTTREVEVRLREAVHDDCMLQRQFVDKAAVLRNTVTQQAAITALSEEELFAELWSQLETFLATV